MSECVRGAASLVPVVLTVRLISILPGCRYQGLSERREDGVVTVRLGSHDD